MALTPALLGAIFCFNGFTDEPPVTITGQGGHDPPTVREASPRDAEPICRIYNHYVEQTISTFELQPVTPGAMSERINRILDLDLPWLALTNESELLAYAYAAPWKERGAYRHSVESTVYVAPQHTGRGLGRQIYRALMDTLRQRPIRSVLGGIALPNPASIALHERLGFRKVAQLHQIGWKFDHWIDVGYWQLVLDGQPSPPVSMNPPQLR